MSDYCDCWGQPDVAAMHKERDELRSQVERLRAERDRYRDALLDVRATCDGNVAGERLRASYKGISRYITRALRDGAA